MPSKNKDIISTVFSWLGLNFLIAKAENANATVNKAKPIPTSKEFIPNAKPSDPIDV
jgi:hypothetical protein